MPGPQEAHRLCFSYMDLDSGLCVNIKVSSRIIGEVGVKAELALVGFVLVGLGPRKTSQRRKDVWLTVLQVAAQS